MGSTDAHRTRVITAIGVTIATVAAFLLAAPGTAGAVRPPVGERLFTQNFDGTELNRSRWSPCYWWAARGCTNLANNELQWYVPEQVQLANGTLRLVAKPAMVLGVGGRPFGYVSGLVSNISPQRNLFSFTYGYVEARARVPKGAGLWSALWMLPTSRESEPEIDIFEVIGDHPDRAWMTLHYLQNGQDKQRKFNHRGASSFAKGWHDFGLLWTPDVLIWFVDGAPRWFVTNTAQIPDEPMYLLANLAVGGTHTGAPTPATHFPATLRFDSIKVWALPD